MKLFLTILLLSFSVLAKPAEKPEYSKTYERGPYKIQVEVDKLSIRLDERLRMTFTMQAPNGSLPTPANLDKALEQFAYTNTPPAPGKNEYVYLLEPRMFQDKVEIGSMEWSFPPLNKDGQPQTFSLDPITVKVANLSEQEFKRITTPNTASILDSPATPPRKLWPWLCLLPIPLSLMGLVAWLKKRRKKAAPPPPPIPAHIIALGRLESLEKQGLVHNGDFMPFYNEIQQILREYLEGRFQIKAPERTTEEFLEELKSTQVAQIKQFNDKLAIFLKHCDLVRFAASIPTETEIKETFQACKEVVVATIPEETPEAGK